MPTTLTPAYPPPILKRLPLSEQPAYRVAADSAACNLVELLAALIGGAAQVEAAQRLVARFGSLQAIARADVRELAGVPGLGPSSAARLKAAVELGRRLGEPRPEDRVIRGPADAAAILMPRIGHLEQEYLMVLLLDTRNRVMGEPREIYHGSLNTSLVRVGEVFRDAIRANAAALIVSHNHPSQDPSPSREDAAVSRSLVEAGKLLDIQLLDHIIVTSHRFVSLKERGLGFAQE